MENQTFNEWVTKNPGKTLNDYYAIYGKPSIGNITVDHSQQHQSTTPAFYSPIVVATVTNIRIAPWRIFLYTGIVMGSVVLWSILFFIIVYGIAGHFLKDILLKLPGTGNY